MARDAVIDILALYMAVPREFSTAEIEFLAALAQAIQNASLYMALQDDMKELKDDVWSHRLWF